MLASKHFQDAIEPPSTFDIVLLILWSRLGTLLPKKTALREYRGMDGRSPVTGTEWEYEEALKAAQEKGVPDLLAFRNISAAPVETRDREARTRSNAQLDALNAFWMRHFEDRGVASAGYSTYRTLEEFAVRLEESLIKLIDQRVKVPAAGEVSREPIWPGDPFRGLDSYEFQHAPIFFGRDVSVMKTTEQLALNARSGCAFLLVSGPSGSGKSSLVKAGILPRLMRPQRISGMAFLRRAVFRPGTEGADLILGLAKALTSGGEQQVGLPELIAPGQDVRQFATYLRRAVNEPGYPFVNALGRVTESERNSGHLLKFEHAKLVLIIDQLEEIFTLPGIGPAERCLFVQLLGGLARSTAVWVIATFRADFWHRAAEIPEFIALAGGPARIDLTIPSPGELVEMIRKPTLTAGLSFEDHPVTGIALDAVLAEDAAAAPGVLPLLSFTLDELCKDAKARGEAVLTHVSYEALGGLDGAIAKRADEVVHALPEIAQAALPRVLRALTTMTDTTEQMPVAKSAPLASFVEGSPARMLVDALVGARLLVATSQRAIPAVRLAHEALIGRWERARDQLLADRRDLEIRALVERQLGRWNQARGRAQRLLLLRDPDLANAVDLAGRWANELDAPILDFIRHSGRRARRTRILATAAAFLVICTASLLASFFYGAWRDSQVSESRFLADRSRRFSARGDGVTAILIALEGLPDLTSKDLFQRLRPQVPEAQHALDAELRALRERGVLAGQSGAVKAVKFSPDGRRVISASEDNTTWLREADTGKLLAVLGGYQASFSADGRRIVTTSKFYDDKIARLWDANTGKGLAVLRGHKDRIWSAAFSADGGRVVIASDDKTARIWDAVTGKTVATLAGHEEIIRTAAFSPDGRRIVTASDDKTARVWDAATSGLLLTLKGHEREVFTASFSPDGHQIVTTSADLTIRLWDAGSGRRLRTLEGSPSTQVPARDIAYLLTATFSPDGLHVLAVFQDNAARLWEAATGRLLYIFGHEDRVWSANFSSDGRRIVTTSEDNTARVWERFGGTRLGTLAGHESAVWSAAFSPDDSRIITGSSDNTARLWDAVSGKPYATSATLSGHTGNVNAVAISPDARRIVTASDDKTARVWDAGSGNVLRILTGHEDRVNSAGFSPDGRRIITASDDKSARVWDAASGNVVFILRGHQTGVETAAFSQNARRILTSSEEFVTQLWNADTGTPLAALAGTAGTFSPDGTRVLTVTQARTARLWDAENGEPLATLAGHNAQVFTPFFSPDGRRVITSSDDGTVRLWEAENGRPIAVLHGQASIWALAFSADGRRVLTGSDDNSLGIWDAESGKPLATLIGHEERVRFGAFTSDGRNILTASQSSEAMTMMLWDAKGGQAFTTIVSNAARNLVVALSRDGHRIVVASGEETAEVWTILPLQGLIDRVKSVAHRCLTPRQRLAFHLARDIPHWCYTVWPYEPATALQDVQGADEAAWSRLQDARDIDRMTKFLANFPSSVHREEAETRLMCENFDKQLASRFVATKQDLVSSALAGIREMDEKRPESCKVKPKFFSGQIKAVIACYNKAIYVQLNTWGDKGFIWTYSTEADPGRPQRNGQWIFGTTGSTYYCVKDIAPLEVWPGQSITSMRRMD
jgi:WD40 repeat protein